MFRKIRELLKKFEIPILVIPILFLIVGIFTLSDYGVNWDNSYHFNRGQAYFWYFLTGKKNFNDLPNFKISSCTSGNLGLFVKCNDKSERRSYYQYNLYDFNFWITNDSGHPPLNDILASLSNYIFYQKLGIINDTLSYHIFIIISSFMLVLGVAYFVKSELGIFPAIVSSLVLASYPLFFSESHFNIKDPPETVFFGLTLIFLYWGVVKNSWKFIIASAIAAGLALGIKLNIVFAALIVGPWLIYYLSSKLSLRFSFKKLRIFLGERKFLILSLILFLPISFGIVYIFWPYLWQNPRNVFNILGYYTQIGVGTPADMVKYLFHGWNLYPIYWISVTTTIPVLLLTVLGIFSIKLFKKAGKTGFYVFILLWFLIPIIRVSWPNTDIYGGVRQIMEYIPALAILSGMGAFCLIEFSKGLGKNMVKLAYLIISLGLALSVYEVARIHPNENIYFNQLVGDLSGAQARNIPYWGNTYGSVYLQGVKWLNENAEIGAKVALPIGVMSNIPRTMLRSDLDFSKPNWTGSNRKGEYGVEMYFEWPAKYWYSFQYYDKYLDPVYVYSVDGVPLLKIWKNDLVHTKPEFREELLYLPKSIILEKNFLGTDIKIDIGKEIFLTKLMIEHENFGCQNGLLGYVALSIDGKVWQREVEPITSPQVAPGVEGKTIGWSDTNFIYLFAGKKARYIMLDPQIVNSCYLNSAKVAVYGLK
ncbi:glycosyltransferase family 39 protein [Patescibacteria group bacterium]|nr:glycosyltransferase family 39 protein [Patescibacteria group bacterium]